MRVLLAGWFSFLHGEITAGDALALEAVCGALDTGGIRYDVAWSPVFRPGGLSLEDAAPEHYTHLVFVCGPLHGAQVRDLHVRYAGCRRVAVGVSVIDPADPSVTGFDLVLARDGDAGPPQRDLAAVPRTPSVPVVGVILSAGQGEYGARRRHDEVSARLTGWLGRRACARLRLDTRLDSGDWTMCASAAEFAAVIARQDLVVTTRLHGLVLALRHGVPALAVDPVAGGGKVTAQALAWQWPAVVTAEESAREQTLDLWWEWCLSAEGAAAARMRAGARTNPLLRSLVEALGH
ncbi:polysaccharide pyruvyl transferase family protein [Actinomadura scrupuli]|uniref:polysaccharide pyruvyl transferase family protein n=1 Tax=Actinomadura scrupuli TaxID=559629 RepID=UPI003D95C079